jgi:hypothetical protein
MKQKKNMLIMIGLAAIMVLASLFGLKMYMKNSELTEHIEKQVPIFVAKTSIFKGDIVRSSDYKQTLLPKSYVGFTPLTPAEIVGKYAAVDILVGEPFRLEKLSYEAIKEEARTLVQEERLAEVECIIEDKLAENNDTITISLSMFRNIDLSLREGDYIDIMGIKEGIKNSTMSPKYSAIHVKIASFVKEGAMLQSARVQAKNSDDLVTTAIADSIVLEMKPNEVKNFLTLYYKSQKLNVNRYFNRKNENIGHLWMIRSTKVMSDSILKEKSKMLLDYKRVVQRKRARKRAPQIEISYEN